MRYLAKIIGRGDEMESKMPIYYICNMKKSEHILAYIINSLVAGVVVYLFYHSIIAGAIGGYIIGILLEKLYANSTIKKRQKALRLQFRDFLEAMSVAARAGSVEVQAIKSAAKDLRLSYTEQTDIVREIDNIITSYEGGGIAINDLFADFAKRSRLTDISNFATIYGIIEGKSDRFGDIVMQTNDIIGEKIEVEQEIETGITAAKSETNVMLVMPVIIVVLLSVMGGGFMDSLFTTAMGRVAATIALVLFVISFILAKKFTDIDV